MSTHPDGLSLLDGALVLYQREGSKRSRWHCRFINPLKDASQYYVRVSLKTSQLGEATERALDLYREYQARKHLGLSSGKTTIKDVYNNGYQHLDEVAQRRAKRHYQNTWLPFFGDTDLSKPTSDLIPKLIDHRISQRLDDANRSYFIASKTSVSATSLRQEIGLLKRLLKVAKRYRLINDLPYFPTINPAEKKYKDNVHLINGPDRRGRFTDEDYQQLTRYFSKVRNALNDVRHQPKCSDPNSPWDPKSNHYLSPYKFRRLHGLERKPRPPYPSIIKNGEPTPMKWLGHPRARYSQATLYFISMLISQTGIRPTEAFALQHRDIELRRDRNDQYFTVVNIRSSVSKVGKRREAVATDRWETYSRYKEYLREIRFCHNRNPEPTDYLFAQYSDPKFQRKNHEFSQGFQDILKSFDQPIHKTHPDGMDHITTYNSLYSLRSFYITTRLKNEVDIYLISKQCGSSVQTIEKYYDDSLIFSFREAMTKLITSGPDSWQPSQRAKARLASFSDEATFWGAS